MTKFIIKGTEINSIAGLTELLNKAMIASQSAELKRDLADNPDNRAAVIALIAEEDGARDDVDFREEALYKALIPLRDQDFADEIIAAVQAKIAERASSSVSSSSVDLAVSESLVITMPGKTKGTTVDHHITSIDEFIGFLDKNKYVSGISEAILAVERDLIIGFVSKANDGQMVSITSLWSSIGTAEFTKKAQIDPLLAEMQEAVDQTQAAALLAARSPKKRVKTPPVISTQGSVSGSEKSEENETPVAQAKSKWGSLRSSVNSGKGTASNNPTASPLTRFGIEVLFGKKTPALTAAAVSSLSVNSVSEELEEDQKSKKSTGSKKSATKIMRSMFSSKAAASHESDTESEGEEKSDTPANTKVPAVDAKVKNAVKVEFVAALKTAKEANIETQAGRKGVISTYDLFVGDDKFQIEGDRDMEACLTEYYTNPSKLKQKNVKDLMDYIDKLPAIKDLQALAVQLKQMGGEENIQRGEVIWGIVKSIENAIEAEWINDRSTSADRAQAGHDINVAHAKKVAKISLANNDIDHLYNYFEKFVTKGGYVVQESFIAHYTQPSKLQKAGANSEGIKAWLTLADRLKAQAALLDQGEEKDALTAKSAEVLAFYNAIISGINEARLKVNTAAAATTTSSSRSSGIFSSLPSFSSKKKSATSATVLDSSVHESNLKINGAVKTLAKLVIDQPKVEEGLEEGAGGSSVVVLSKGPTKPIKPTQKSAVKTAGGSSSAALESKEESLIITTQGITMKERYAQRTSEAFAGTPVNIASFNADLDRFENAVFGNGNVDLAEEMQNFSDWITARDNSHQMEQRFDLVLTIMIYSLERSQNIEVCAELLNDLNGVIDYGLSTERTTKIDAAVGRVLQAESIGASAAGQEKQALLARFLRINLEVDNISEVSDGEDLDDVDSLEGGQAALPASFLRFPAQENVRPFGDLVPNDDEDSVGAERDEVLNMELDEHDLDEDLETRIPDNIIALYSRYREEVLASEGTGRDIGQMYMNITLEDDQGTYEATFIVSGNDVTVESIVEKVGESVYPARDDEIEALNIHADHLLKVDTLWNEIGIVPVGLSFLDDDGRTENVSRSTVLFDNDETGVDDTELAAITSVLSKRAENKTSLEREGVEIYANEGEYFMEIGSVNNQDLYNALKMREEDFDMFDSRNTENPIMIPVNLDISNVTIESATGVSEEDLALSRGLFALGQEFRAVRGEAEAVISGKSAQQQNPEDELDLCASHLDALKRYESVFENSGVLSGEYQDIASRIIGKMQVLSAAVFQQNFDQDVVKELNKINSEHDAALESSRGFGATFDAERSKLDALSRLKSSITMEENVDKGQALSSIVSLIESVDERVKALIAARKQAYNTNINGIERELHEFMEKGGTTLDALIQAHAKAIEGFNDIAQSLDEEYIDVADIKEVVSQNLEKVSREHSGLQEERAEQERAEQERVLAQSRSAGRVRSTRRVLASSDVQGPPQSQLVMGSASRNSGSSEILPPPSGYFALTQTELPVTRSRTPGRRGKGVSTHLSQSSSSDSFESPQQRTEVPVVGRRRGEKGFGSNSALSQDMSSVVTSERNRSALPGQQSRQLFSSSASFESPQQRTEVPSGRNRSALPGQESRQLDSSSVRGERLQQRTEVPVVGRRRGEKDFSSNSALSQDMSSVVTSERNRSALPGQQSRQLGSSSASFESPQQRTEVPSGRNTSALSGLYGSRNPQIPASNSVGTRFSVSAPSSNFASNDRHQRSRQQVPTVMASASTHSISHSTSLSAGFENSADFYARMNAALCDRACNVQGVGQDDILRINQDVLNRDQNAIDLVNRCKGSKVSKYKISALEKSGNINHATMEEFKVSSVEQSQAQGIPRR